MAKHILVVDDEKEVTMSLQGFFSALGHEMLTALDGKKAMDIIESKPPDLVLLDIRMPGIDGIQILKRIRKDKPGIKVIVITAYGKEVKEKVEEIGVEGFFSKPLNLVKLMDEISIVLGEKKAKEAISAIGLERKPDAGIVPKARLLFVEPSPMAYGFACGLFVSEDSLIEGEFEIKVVFDMKEVMDAVRNFFPDLVIVYDAFYNLDEATRFGELLLSPPYGVKSVILHSLIPRSDFEIKRLENAGIMFCNQNTMDDQSFRTTNRKLADFVTKTCIARRLVKETKKERTL